MRKWTAGCSRQPMNQRIQLIRFVCNSNKKGTLCYLKPATSAAENNLWQVILLHNVVIEAIFTQERKKEKLTNQTKLLKNMKFIFLRSSFSLLTSLYFYNFT